MTDWQSPRSPPTPRPARAFLCIATRPASTCSEESSARSAAPCSSHASGATCRESSRSCARALNHRRGRSGRRRENGVSMSRILVLYGTSEGHTRKVANAIGDTMREEGLDVDVVHVDDLNPDPSRYTAVIVAASVHAGGYQKAVANWVRAHATELDRLPAAFVSVCLSILSKNEAGRKEAEAIPQRFLAMTNWRPAKVKIVA